MNENDLITKNEETPLYIMKPINIQGKDYFGVHERTKSFRRNPKYEGWSILTEILYYTSSTVVMKAIIKDEKGVIRSEGIAQEDKEIGKVNKKSYYENCQTSAIGRALGFLDIGIDNSIASADEMKQAISLQDAIIKIEKTEIEIVELCKNDETYSNMIAEIETLTDIDDLKPVYTKYKNKKYIGYLLQKKKEQILNNSANEIFK